VESEKRKTFVFVSRGRVGGAGDGEAHERGRQREIGDVGAVELVTKDSTAVLVEIADDI